MLRYRVTLVTMVRPNNVMTIEHVSARVQSSRRIGRQPRIVANRAVVAARSGLHRPGLWAVRIGRSAVRGLRQPHPRTAAWSTGDHNDHNDAKDE